MHLVAALSLATIVAAAPQDTPPKPVAGAPRVVVYTFATTGVPDMVGSSLSEVVAVQVARSGRYDVLTWANVMNLMKLEEVRQALGTDDPKVIIKLSEKFNAAYIVTGTVNQLGSAYVVTLQLVNVAAQKVDRRLSQTLYGDAAQISASLRTASQALVSEISPDKAQTVSEKAFDAVIRSETPKHLNVRLSGGVRFPLGASQSDVGLYYVRAPLYVTRLDAGWMVTQWLETGLDLSFGVADGGESFQGILKVSDSTSDPVSGNPKTNNAVTVLNLKPTFAVRDISAAVQAKVRPPEGIFLPYATFKLGAAMDRREVRSETTSAAFPGVGGTACPGYAMYDASSGACLVDLAMAPKTAAAWRTGFLGGVGVGLDLLIWRHVALTAQLGYELRVFAGEEDFDLTTQKAYAGDAMTGVQPGNATFLDRYNLPSMEQSFTATLGAMGYF